jgi:hypothetical protein
MELAAAAMTAVGSAISGATSAIGGALGMTGAGAPMALAGSQTALAAGSTGSLFSSILQGGATVASVMGALSAGDEKASDLKARANDAIDEQGIERLRGIERRDGLRRSLLERLGQQDVAAAASGVDLSFGTPSLARDEAARDGERALTQDQSTEDLRINRLQQRADELRSGAKAARRAGVIRALGSGVASAYSMTRRG